MWPIPVGRHVEFGPRDADHARRRPRDRHRGADNVPAPAEGALPQRVREHDDARRARHVIVGRKGAPGRDRNPEKVEEAIRDAVAHGLANDRPGRHGAVDAQRAGNVRDRILKLLQRGQLLGADQAARKASVREERAHRVDVLRARIRKRLQQRGVDGAEQRDRRGDPQGERAGGRQDERGMAQQAARDARDRRKHRCEQYH
jgi:hypothetical protein